MKTKEEIKSGLLEPIAAKLKSEWHSQAVHKLAVGVWFLDHLGIKDAAKREAALEVWDETPGSFGSNCSALGQALGRETTKTRMEKTFAGF